MILRSLLFVPAYNKKFLENSIKYNCDAIIYDLEDSVPEVYKEDARDFLKSFLTRAELQSKKIFIRINALDSRFMLDDLMAVMQDNVDGFVLPKIQGVEDVKYFDKLVSQLELELDIAENTFKFLPLIETASAVLDVFSIAGFDKRNIALCFGGEDFLNDIHGTHGEPPIVFDYPRAKIVLAARASGICPIDTPYLDLHDDQGFMEVALKSYEIGFGGSLLIHPSQIELANQAYFPTEAEILHAKEVYEAVLKSQEKGSGVAMLNGQMVGPPMRKRAEKILDIVAQSEKGNQGD